MPWWTTIAAPSGVALDQRPTDEVPHPEIDHCKDCGGVGCALGCACHGFGTASGRSREVVIDASGQCPTCQSHGAHELGVALTSLSSHTHPWHGHVTEHGAVDTEAIAACAECDDEGFLEAPCPDCKGNGTASGNPLVAWHERTDAEHDDFLAEKRAAVDEQIAQLQEQHEATLAAEKELAGLTPALRRFVVSIGSSNQLAKNLSDLQAHATWLATIHDEHRARMGAS